MRVVAIATLFFICDAPCLAQKRAAIPAAQVVEEVRNYRLNNEDRIVRELTEFLAIPNVASDTQNIQKNATHLVEMLEARGIETHLLPISGRGPVVFGKLNVSDAKRTVIFYAHYDGQPVDPAAWTDGKPFEPALRSDAIEAGGKRIALPDKHPGAYNDNWRIYARSASDDKSPIVALLAAIDALRAARIPLGVNLKVIFEGEEEAGSINLRRTLDRGWAGTPVGTPAGVFWQSRRYRPGYHRVRAGARTAQRALRKLGAESSDGVVALAGVHEGCGWTRAHRRIL